MKFRAKSVDLTFIRTFAQLLSALSRCSRSFVLRITPDKMIFVLSDKEAANATSVVSAWGEIPKDPYFTEYAMEGVSSKSNEIYLEICPEKIAGCLSTLKSSNSVSGLKIKLTKKVVACLTFECEFQSVNTAPTCVHDVPVTLVVRKNWCHFQEPSVPGFDLSIGMPDLKHVRLALERMKNLGRVCSIIANDKGKLTFTVDNYNVKCSVKFEDLRIYDIGEDGVHDSEGNGADDAVKEFSVEVDMKTLHHVVSPELTRPSNFIFSVCEDRRLHVYFLFGDISLQYCVPSIGSDQ